MKVIVEQDGNIDSYLLRYSTHHEMLGKQYKIIEIEEKYLRRLSTIVKYVEPNFIIKLHGETERIDFRATQKQDMILVVIGRRISDKEIDIYYNITKGRVEAKQPQKNPKPYLCISCFGETDTIDAISYIQCIRYLYETFRALNKPIVIYSNIEVPQETYRYRTLCYKIINIYLKEMKGVFISKCLKKDTYKYYKTTEKPYEVYDDTILYVEDDLNEALKKVIPILSDLGSSENSSSCNNRIRFQDFHKYQRQNNTLYPDLFYQSINPNEQIYVLLNPGNYRRPEYYESLGLSAVRIIDEYSVLYGMKSQFDALSEVLREEVAPGYDMPIMSHVFCFRNIMTQQTTATLVPADLQYKGAGVYIGLVTIDNVDYTSEALRFVDGTSRIAAIWEQQRAGEGGYYLKTQIDTALSSPIPAEIVPLPLGDSMSTMMLAIAGGESLAGNYRGVATEAEFIVAKINPAPAGIQTIYGGIPSNNAVTMPDVLIGVVRLMNFANAAGRPLVLCIPFNSNIDAHDGSFTLNQILTLLAQRTKMTIVAAAGEEADKLHHYSITGQQTTANIINLRVDKEEQNVVGVMYQRFVNVSAAYLYPPPQLATERIDLRVPGIVRLGETTVYSNGQRLNFQNGARDILFRLDNPAVGGWRIELTLISQALTQVDLWLAQQELNPFTVFRPADPFKTIGSVAASRTLMSVGSYDKEAMVVLRSSGRGYSWDDRVKPLLVTHSDNIMAPCRINEWVSISGTLPAASIMAGVAAVFYSKFLTEQVFPLPNTIIMNTIILGGTEQFEGVVYPNPSEGYGIFNLLSLRELLAIPIL